MMTLNQDRWLSVDEIAAYLGISKETIYRWVEKQKIPAHRVGKFWKFKPSEVDTWIISGSAGLPAAPLLEKISR